MSMRRWEYGDPADIIDRLRAERQREERWQAEEAARLLAYAQQQQAKAAKVAARRAERDAAQRAAACANPFGAICKYIARAEKHRRLVYLIKREGRG